ncbi:MAG: septum site-determining protein MinC [Marinomonas sp.]|jgi:septum site-determining protein MinC|uniref:Probable septum site-determining protein MinC n=1 Tax=Marinomonas pontica TaxID=264739 RepID=A0ABM8FDK5_9GAMM|nr:septum site-determining protein MinC [Marinomonas pontica]MCW8357143.1 septum site-determining protein MinC [Marinomonas pontica]BDX02974.1 putative septum site-determining protein MinC [Marinomonas pontica]
MTDSGFRLKGSVVTTVLLEVQVFSLDDIVFHLKEKIEQVPHFFHQAPIIIDISKMKRGIILDEFETLIQSVSALGLGVIGWRCDPDNLPAWKSSVTIPLLPASKARSINAAPTVKEEASPDVVVKTVVEERLVPQATKVITKPIRSGQQVYAEGDLIILAQVSAGAEVLADGNIHVYGALRGRALAGVKGDVDARIFCKSMEAELVSIAGNFMLSDALQNIVWKDSAQVLLVDDSLEIVPL